MYVTPKRYSVYIITNYTRSVLYTGVTNNLEQRIIEHYIDRGNPNSFTGKYQAHYLLYFECFDYILNAIAREKEIKDWNRSRKEQLINKKNPAWEFLNEKLFGKWPPDRLSHRRELR